MSRYFECWLYYRRIFSWYRAPLAVQRRWCACVWLRVMMLTPAWNRASEANCAKLLFRRRWPSAVILQVRARSRCNPRHHALQLTRARRLMWSRYEDLTSLTRSCSISRSHVAGLKALAIIRISSNCYQEHNAKINITRIPIFFTVRSVIKILRRCIYS